VDAKDAGKVVRRPGLVIYRAQRATQFDKSVALIHNTYRIKLIKGSDGEGYVAGYRSNAGKLCQGGRVIDCEPGPEEPTYVRSRADG
jgi:hypothetical protein